MVQDGKSFTPLSKSNNADFLLQQAADGEAVLWVAMRPYCATLRALPWAESTRHSTTRSNTAHLAPIMPAAAAALLLFPNYELTVVLATDPTSDNGHPFRDHYWMLETPQTITRERVYFHGADAPAAKVATTRKRQRQDALAVELDEILVQMTKRTPAKVMAKLREQIGKPHTCILRDVGGGLEWENNDGEKCRILKIKSLTARIAEWKKTS